MDVCVILNKYVYHILHFLKVFNLGSRVPTINQILLYLKLLLFKLEALPVLVILVKYNLPFFIGLEVFEFVLLFQVKLNSHININ